MCGILSSLSLCGIFTAINIIVTVNYLCYLDIINETLEEIISSSLCCTAEVLLSAGKL